MLRRIRHRLALLHSKLGPLGTIRYVAKRLLDDGAANDYIGHYSFTADRPFGSLPSDDVDATTINWVVPDFGVGSGGHINIFRLISILESSGFKNRIYISGHSEFDTAARAREVLQANFSALEATVELGHENMAPAEFTIATSWPTAYAVHNFRGTRQKLYFVQDYEPFFYAHGSEYWMAEATYRMGFAGITAGGWLAQKLATEHGMQTVSMGFSYDRNLYRTMTSVPLERQRVFFYARPVTPRRAFELGLLAMHQVASRLPEVEFVLAGWDVPDQSLPFRHQSLGNVAVSDLPALYNTCDVALVLSATNLSLLPLELMACGVPVVSNRGDNVEWLLNDDNALLCDPTPEALAEGVITLLSDSPKRERLRDEGLAFAKATSWDVEGQKVAATLTAMASGRRIT